MNYKAVPLAGILNPIRSRCNISRVATPLLHRVRALQHTPGLGIDRSSLSSISILRQAHHKHAPDICATPVTTHTHTDTSFHSSHVIPFHTRIQRGPRGDPEIKCSLASSGGQAQRMARRPDTAHRARNEGCTRFFGCTHNSELATIDCLAGLSNTL